MEDTNIQFTAVHVNKAALQNTAITNGCVYFVEDTKELFYDFGSNRAEVKDILILEKEADRTNVLFSPLNKFYFILETQKLWVYKDGVWYQINSDPLEADGQSVQIVDNVLSAIGVVARTGEVLYDWIGTNAEYEAAVADGTIQPNWVCYITDDEEVGALYSNGVSGDIQQQLDQKQDKQSEELNTNDKTIVGAINELHALLGDVSRVLDEINGEVV